MLKFVRVIIEFINGVYNLSNNKDKKKIIMKTLTITICYNIFMSRKQ